MAIIIYYFMFGDIGLRSGVTRWVHCGRLIAWLVWEGRLVMNTSGGIGFIRMLILSTIVVAELAVIVIIESDPKINVLYL